MKNKFKVGDRVVVKDVRSLYDSSGVSVFIGKEAVITRVSHQASGNNCKCKFEGYFDQPNFSENELERIKVKATKLSKKMRPNAEISEDGEWLYV